MPAPELTGALNVFAEGGDHSAADSELASRIKSDAPNVVIAVLDTGVHASSKLLSSRVKAQGDFHMEKDPFAYGPGDIGDYHGTKVAAQAVSGSDKIDVVDVRVQTGQAAGGDNSASVARGLEWAIKEQGARIVTCSVDIDWSKPAIQKVIDENPNVLFLTTAGNNKTAITARKIDNGGEPKPNALLVGGVTLEGKQHPLRGYGSAVDLMVPSGAASDDERAVNVHMPLAAAKQELVQKGAKSSFDKDTIEAYEREGYDFIPAGESGVSFGLPVVANIAAKMALIDPSLKASEMAEILRTQAVQLKNTNGLDGLSKSGGVIDAVKAYDVAHQHRLAVELQASVSTATAIPKVDNLTPAPKVAVDAPTEGVSAPSSTIAPELTPAPKVTVEAPKEGVSAPSSTIAPELTPAPKVAVDAPKEGVSAPSSTIAPELTPAPKVAVDAPKEGVSAPSSTIATEAPKEGEVQKTSVRDKLKEPSTKVRAKTDEEAQKTTVGTTVRERSKSFTEGIDPNKPKTTHKL